MNPAQPRQLLAGRAARFTCLTFALVLATNPGCSTSTSCEETRTCGGGDAVGGAGFEAGGAGGAGESTSGAAASMPGGLVGMSCADDNAVTCPGPASGFVAVCDDGVWELLSECDEGSLCDSQNPHCEPIVPGCETLRPGQSFCDGSTLRKCGPDKVTTADTVCAGGCDDGQCLESTNGGAGGTNGAEATAGAGGAPETTGSAGSSAEDPGEPEGVCAPNPCANGSCVPKGAAYQCQCDDGYTGDLCEQNIDDCTPNPCENGARCDDLVAGYECVCAKTFTGEHCETPRFEIIEPLREEHWTYGTMVSGDGKVVVGDMWNLTVMRGFRWENGIVETLETTPNDDSSTARGLSEDGVIVAGNVRIPSGDLATYYATRWSPDGAEVLDSIPDAGLFFADAMSPDGSVLVGSTSTAIAAMAVTWPGLVTTHLGTDVYVSAVSERGEVIVGWDSNSALQWRNGVRTPLETPSGEERCRARDVSRDGSIAVGDCNQREAVLWRNGIAEVLARPKENLFASPEAKLYAINRDGDAAVGMVNDAATYADQPFIWDPVNGVRWLSPLLEEIGLDPTMYFWNDLGFGGDISNDGKVIVGTLRTPDNTYRAFIARLP